MGSWNNASGGLESPAIFCDQESGNPEFPSVYIPSHGNPAQHVPSPAGFPVRNRGNTAGNIPLQVSSVNYFILQHTYHYFKLFIFG